MNDLATLYSCAVAAAHGGLVAAGRPDVGRVTISIGPPALDDCCEGTLYLRTGRTYPSSSFPTEDVVPIGHCDYPQAVECWLGVARCAPTLTDQGTPPSAADEIAAAQSLSDDLQSVFVALRDSGWWAEEGDVLVGGIEYGATEGGCIVGEVRLLAEIELLAAPTP